MELVHRESPRSPFYNPADTPYQRMASTIRRSIARAHRLNPNAAGEPNTPSAVIVSQSGEYLMNVSLGNPPATIVGIADTGSDLIWTQCKPCTDCFKQAPPLFDPSKSSTYKDVSCRASLCGAVSQTSCGEGEAAGLCEYSYSYGDSSYTLGTLATETFTIGSTSGRPVSFPNVLFGCGHENGGNFGGGQMNGIVGLGGGDASLISQMGKATGGKFSYCLVPFFSERGRSSKLNFGANAVVAGSGVVSTPLIQGEQKTFYYLTLEAVSVGKTRIDFPSEGPSATDGGNIIIDSGTTLTLLPSDFYTQIEAAMAKSVKLPSASDPSQILSLCYKAATDVGLNIPTVTFHFKGADVGLGMANSFVRVAEDIICFTLKPGDMAIYGNLAQMNYLVGYDTQNMKLSFKPVDCTSN
ncbi:aspartic proteinase CDR1-like [Rhodamnia argentea]|uniref:Aspartic proteinase CDR1-like n=1 Tax=Rhodamnia argentea TaxID=178133 RepID=A0ABM3H6D5_9MYRT|nr:aspartic proteinase CDR1-like [Rhodamnia argentea]